MFQKLTFFLASCCFLVASALSAQALFTGGATLTGSQQSLPVVTRAQGEISASINLDGSVVVSGSFSGLSSPVATNIAGGMHLHLGYAGENGPVLLPLNLTLAEDSLSGTLDPAMNTFALADLAALVTADFGQLYVNLHTRDYPGGELRGQLVFDGGMTGFANLLGSNENTAVMTDAYGAVFADLNDTTLVVTGSFSNLSSPLATEIAGGAHLHIGLPGASGGVDLILSATASPDGRSGIFTSGDNEFALTSDQVAAFTSGNYYVNIHSENHPGGELRGQLLPLAQTTLRAHLSGANEWPVVTTMATGQVIAHLGVDSLRVTGSFSGLSSAVRTDIGGGAHLHLGMAGENGNVAFPLVLALDADSLGGTFSLSANVFDLTESQITALLNRGVYVNIHTRNYPSGELRGQLLPESQAVFTAYLNGNQEIPAALTPAYGMVKIEKLGNLMIATGSFTDLSSELATNIGGGAHLHVGYPGQSGPVALALGIEQEADLSAGVLLPAANTFSVDSTFADTLDRRQLYVNVHSIDYPSGELRGQVLAEAGAYFYAPLSSSSETAYTPSLANGMVAAEVRDTVVTLVGAFQDLGGDFNASVAGGAHLHGAVAGNNGGIVTRINTEIAADARAGVMLPDSNVLRLTADQLEMMLNRQVYVNVHSTTFGAGEVRGQMLPLAGTYFHTSLMSINSLSANGSAATGGLKLELTGDQLTLSGSVNDLESDFNLDIAQGAHLHLAPAGATGPVVVILNPAVDVDNRAVVWTADQNNFTLADSVVTALYAGNIYANVHTVDNPSGEVRGQVRADLNFRPEASEITSPADGAMITLEGAAETAFSATWNPSTDADGDSIVYVWQLATDADFSTVVFSANVGGETAFNTDFGTVDALLASAGVEAGASATLYHRVVAGDGSNHWSSPGKSVNLTRGVIVGVEDNQPRGFSALLYPNVTTNGQLVKLDIATDESFRGELSVIDPMGRRLSSRSVEVFAGEQRFTVTDRNLTAGQYVVVLRLANGRIAYASRLLVN